MPSDCCLNFSLLVLDFQFCQPQFAQRLLQLDLLPHCCYISLLFILISFTFQRITALLRRKGAADENVRQVCNRGIPLTPSTVSYYDYFPNERKVVLLGCFTSLVS